MRKYGYDAFTKEILEDCTSDVNELLVLEVYYKQMYDSFKNGYNLIEGLEIAGNPTLVPVNQYDIEGNYIDSYDSISQAAELNEIRGGTISNVARGFCKTAGGYQWSYKLLDRMDKVILEYGLVEVFKYDLDGNFIEGYESIDAASIDNKNCNKPNICRVAQEAYGRKSSGGFQWRYYKKMKIDKVKRLKTSIGPKTVYQYDLTGVLIDSYDSGREAARENDLDYKKISYYTLRNKPYGGYQWSYKLL